jgi:hypothetical protein
MVKENNELSFKRVVLIPAGQALIMGAFIGAAAMSGLRAAGREWFNSGIAIWLLATSLTYWRLSLRSYEPLKPEPEQRVYTDTINTTLIDESDNPYTRGKRITVEVDRVKFILFSRKVLKGLANEPPDKVTYSKYQGRGKIFSRNEFENVRERLLEGKVLRPVNPYAPTQSVYVSRAGVAYFQYYARLKTATSSLIIPDYLQGRENALQRAGARTSTQEMIEL